MGIGLMCYWTLTTTVPLQSHCILCCLKAHDKFMCNAFFLEWCTYSLPTPPYVPCSMCDTMCQCAALNCQYVPAHLQTPALAEVTFKTY